MISTHAPSRERLFCSQAEHNRHYFNPRSLAGATQPSLADQTFAEISIHAPSRERPNFNKYKIFRIVISIHAPLRERRAPTESTIPVVLFQSTLPCGSDAKAANRQAQVAISIHAPLRERPGLYGTSGSVMNFNPRSLAGATAIDFLPCSMLLFQSTLPCGSDGPF